MNEKKLTWWRCDCMYVCAETCGVVICMPILMCITKSLCPNEWTNAITVPVSAQLKPSTWRLSQGSSGSYVYRLDRIKVSKSFIYLCHMKWRANDRYGFPDASIDLVLLKDQCRCATCLWRIVKFGRRQPTIYPIERISFFHRVVDKATLMPCGLALQITLLGNLRLVDRLTA